MKWVDRLVQICAMIAGYTLFGLMLYIVVGVVLRYVFGAPLFGAQDAMQMMLILITLLGLGYTARSEGHVAVDLFEGVLGHYGRLLGDVLARLLGVGLMVVLAWGAYHEMLDSLEWGDVTNMLRLPTWPFHAVIIFSAGLYALVLFIQLFRLPVRRSAEVPACGASPESK